MFKAARIVLSMLALVAVAAGAYAGGNVHTHRFIVTYGTNATAMVVVTNNGISGYVQEIYADSPTAAATGTVALYYTPLISTMADVNLYTNSSIGSDFVTRPRVDATDVPGAALTGDPPVRYLLDGEIVYCSISNNTQTTGTTWQVILKTADQ